jgi:hypothetical protein
MQTVINQFLITINQKLLQLSLSRLLRRVTAASVIHVAVMMSASGGDAGVPRQWGRSASRATAVWAASR